MCIFGMFVSTRSTRIEAKRNTTYIHTYLGSII